MVKKQISSGSPHETPISYSKAVRVNNVITISGTAATVFFLLMVI